MSKKMSELYPDDLALQQMERTKIDYFKDSELPNLLDDEDKEVADVEESPKDRPNKPSKKTTKKTPQESEGQTSVKKIYISKELFRLILGVKTALSLNESGSHSADSILKLLISGKYKSKITDEDDLAMIKQYISKFQ